MYKIAVLPCDGIGKEVTREGMKVLEAAGERFNIDFAFTEYPHGADHYLKTGEVISDESIEDIAQNSAIFLGAVGDPRVKTGILEKGLLLKLRFHFDQYVNLRPIKAYPNTPFPLKDKTYKDLQFFFVRENTEDFYIGLGGRVTKKTNKETLELVRDMYNVKFGVDIEVDRDEEIAYQIGAISRSGAKRVITYAFELAKRKGMNRVTSVDKANVLSDIYGLWREVFDEVATGYEGMETEFSFVDAMSMWMVRKPEWYKVVVSPNMFGDILTDLGAALQGSIGLAASGNINPDGVSMFEPIHGSAPKHAGKNIANPISSIAAAQMMLEELGESEAAAAIERAVSTVLEAGKVRTYDLGGSSSTSAVGDEIVRVLTNEEG